MRGAAAAAGAGASGDARAGDGGRDGSGGYIVGGAAAGAHSGSVKGPGNLL